MTKDEAMKMALEALEFFKGLSLSMNEIERAEEAITAIKEALAQPEQEPMLLIQSHRDNFWCVDLTCNKCYGADFRFKHATPPQRTWVGLMDEEVMEIAFNFDVPSLVVRTAEAKLKEKNNG
jgi:hypothetical protein